MSSEALLQELLDEFQLRKLVHGYCRAVDRGNIAQLRNLYLDKYEKRTGSWKFVDRKIVTDWAQVNDPSSVDLSHPITRDTPRGTPDANDPSHQFFSLLGKDVERLRGDR